MTVCASCGTDNPDGFRFCGGCGAELATQTQAPRDVRRTVTLLFCDLAGYTSTSEGLDPEALRRLQNEYFDHARAAIERHEGTVEKFIGDAVMAVFGIPQLHEDDALRALRAAVELRDAVNDLGLQARIGVNTGEVVAGSGDALVTGDAVNVAARLEQAAPHGEILLGEQTLRLVREAVEIEPLEPLDLKGKGEPVPAYQLISVLETAPERRHDTAMVGRERELGLLEQAFDRSVTERSCHLFTVLGAAGVGKSRLAAELTQDVDATVWTGRCLSYGDGITYWPLIEVFRQAGAEDELERALAMPTPVETAWTVRTFLEAAARERPLVLVFDDIHWAEPTFLDLIEHVADLSRDAPMLLLCMARPELLDDRPAWGGGKLNATAVLLEPLTDAESEVLVTDLAGAQLDEPVLRRIVDAAEGNPFFLEEMVAIVGEGEVDVPSTIQAVLAARLDRLPLEERRVLETAAIEGKVFHRAAIAALAPDDLDLSSHLVSLVRKELIRTEPAEPDAFRFRHQLLRDAAYDGLPKEQRAQLHERFAGWMERSNDELEADELLGYHLEQAHRYRSELGSTDKELADRAAARLAEAGSRAFAHNDMPAAAHLLTRAADLLQPESRERAAVLLELGAALAAIGDFATGEEILSEAIESAKTLGEKSLEARAVAELVLLRISSDPAGRMQEARAEGERLIAALEGSDEHGVLARAWFLIGQADLMAAHFGDMARAMSQSLEHADLAGDVQQQAEAIDWLAVATSAAPIPIPEAIARLEKLLARVPEGSEGEAGLLVNLAALHGMAGRTEEAKRMAAKGRAILGELGLHIMRSAYSIEEASIDYNAGDFGAAEPRLREACETLQRMGERGFLSTVAAELAGALYALDRFDESEDWSHVSEDAAAPEDTPSQVEWRSVRGKLHARRGELEEGIRLAREAVALAEQSDDPSFVGYAVSDLAEVLGLAGEVDEQRTCLERLLELYERRGIVILARRVRGQLSELPPNR